MRIGYSSGFRPRPLSSSVFVFPSIEKVLKKRSTKFRCLYVGLVLLCLQVIVGIVLLNILDRPNVYTSPNSLSLLNSACLTLTNEDIRKLMRSISETDLSVMLLDERLLVSRSSHGHNVTENCKECSCNNAVLAIDFNTLAGKMNQLLEKLLDDDFVPVTFYNLQPQQMIPQLNRVETALFLQRRAVLHIVFLHYREDNTWWYGDINSDPSSEDKLGSLNLSLQQLNIMKSEGAIERFEIMYSVQNGESNLLVPKDVNKYLADVRDSKFLECNITRAALFRRQFHVDKTPEAVRFRHKVWKILSRAKTVLESLKVVFWLSSGTLLGYFRECDIIAHSKDVDIGVWATSYSDKLVSEMQAHGFRLKLSLGLPNDSLELSFLDKSGLKLDIFFFYQDSNYYWNGGTQVKSGKKFKYTFPQFSLCWTLFKDLRVRIPCETESYIQANYGLNWFTPIKVWDWKTSPFNVQLNGVWTNEQLKSAVKVFV